MVEADNRAEVDNEAACFSFIYNSAAGVSVRPRFLKQRAEMGRERRRLTLPHFPGSVNVAAKLSET